MYHPMNQIKSEILFNTHDHSFKMTTENKKILSKRRWNDFSINPKIKKSLYSIKYARPTIIQAKTLKATMIDKKNVFGAARTGSGKTLAYGITIVHQILEAKNKASGLKKRLVSLHKKKSDFELIDGEMVEVEDMIVDNVSSFEDDTCNQSEDDEDSSTRESESYTEIDPEIQRQNVSCPEAIVLVPTRELAYQVKEEIDKICAHTDIKTCCIIGGMNQDRQIRILSSLKPEIIIATPGRLYEIIQGDSVEHLNLFSLACIRSLTIDEADRMVQRGHFEEMLKIVDIINEFKPRRGKGYPFNVYLFSATLTFLHELPDRLKNPYLQKSKKQKQAINSEEHTKKNKILKMIKILGVPKKDTRIIDLNNDETHGRPSSDQLEEFRIHCEKEEKDLHLYYVLNHYKGKRVIIFCNSKDSLRRLVNVLKWLGVSCLSLHSDMDQKKRLSGLEKFRARSDSVMIATDIAARGLDIKELDVVIHYQVPRTCETYIHRSGRTARLDNLGVTFVLCDPSEVHLYRRLCSSINQRKDLQEFDIDINIRNRMRNRVILAQQCDKLDHQLRSSKSERNWFLKASKECDIELDDDDMRHINGRGKMLQKDTDADINKRRQLEALQKSLQKEMKKSIQ